MCIFFFLFLNHRLSSLTIGDSERKSSTTQQREPPTDIANENTGTDIELITELIPVHLKSCKNSCNISSFPVKGPGLVQRCVVVQKDQLGFGFTVCGERVKLVQNVRLGETWSHANQVLMLLF